MNDSATHTQAFPLVYVCFALEEEAVEVRVPGALCKRIVTGIGKVRSTMCLTKAIMEERPAAVINAGTAGTMRRRIGDIIASRQFIDRDHAKLHLPGLISGLSTTDSPLFRHLYSVVDGEESDGRYLVNTGDDFVTAAMPADGDAFDMEAFAEAWVCKEMDIPFVSVKYITDIIGCNSIRHWEEKLADARAALSRYFSRLQGVVRHG